MSKHKTKKGTKINYSATSADLVQYTQKANAHMRVQRIFIELRSKEQKLLYREMTFEGMLNGLGTRHQKKDRITSQRHPVINGFYAPFYIKSR